MLLSASLEAQPLKVVVAGLSHDHAHSIMQQWKRGEVVMLAVAESNSALRNRYQRQYQLPDSLFYPSLGEALRKHKPEIVLAYNSIAEHRAVVEVCAPMGISVMVEKPLATTVSDAERIAQLAAKHNIMVLTNYETTWYPSVHQLYAMSNEQGMLGPIRKMVVHDGHQGPREIGCSDEFLAWLTDPVLNGGGALVDFGCYGANLMTWLMAGKAPKAVMAVTKQIKPMAYPKVDDEATILLEYDDATGIIEASWNWPYGIKDLEVFGTKGYAHALDGRGLQFKKEQMKPEPVAVASLVYDSNLKYLEAILRGQLRPANDLSSLENNLIVVRILDAARRSAKEGKKIPLR